MRRLTILLLLQFCLLEAGCGIVAGKASCDFEGDGPHFLGIMAKKKRFEPFNETCNEIGVHSGPQGGFHVEPAILFRDTKLDDVPGGLVGWTVRSSGGTVLVEDQQAEIYSGLLQKVGDGTAFAFQTVELDISSPSDVLDQQIEIEARIEFDDGRDSVLLSDEVNVVNAR